MLIGKVIVIAYWTCTPLGIKIGCLNPKVGILARYLVCSTCSIGDIGSVWVVPATYLFFLLEINGSGSLILK